MEKRTLITREVERTNRNVDIQLLAKPSGINDYPVRRINDKRKTD